MRMVFLYSAQFVSQCVLIRTGSDGPHRLVCDDDLAPVMYICCDRLHLASDDGHGLMRLALLECLTDTGDHTQTGSESQLDLLANGLEEEKRTTGSRERIELESG